MFTTYPYWDVSYLVATIFTFGSVVWCINASFVWLPLVRPSSEFKGEIADAGGITAFIGATIFEFGSVLLMIEAVNENRTDCFGWAIEDVLEENGMRRVRKGECRHHHGNRGNLVGKGGELFSFFFLVIVSLWCIAIFFPVWLYMERMKLGLWSSIFSLGLSVHFIAYAFHRTTSM